MTAGEALVIPVMVISSAPPAATTFATYTALPCADIALLRNVDAI
jgi:hypothetical protein